jgi:hypothetical protein
MTPRRAGLLVAALHLALVCAVAGSYVVDRSRLPHVWLATLPVDPNAPIRGRYLQMSVVVAGDSAGGAAAALASGTWRVRLEVHDNAIVATADPAGSLGVRPARCGKDACWILAEPLAYYLPEHARDPSWRAAGERLWVEASIPPKGPPRPLRLGKSHLDGSFEVLDID